MRTFQAILIIHICLLISIQCFVLNDKTKEEQIFYPEFSENDMSYADSDICQTTICDSVGKSLKMIMNTSVDPCDDFYEFSCGGWIASHTIPDEKSSLFAENGMNDLIVKRINDSLNEKRSPTDSKAVVFASDLYKSCLDMEKREKVGVTLLKNALNSVGGWPMASPSASFNEKHYDWKESLPIYIAEFGFSPVFDIDIEPDATQTTVKRFHFSPQGTGISPTQLVNRTQNKEIVNAYKNLILELTILMGGKNDSQTQQQVEEIIDFETEIAKQLEIEAKTETSDPNSYYKKMTLKALNQLSEPYVDWVNLTNTIFSKLNSTVRVTSDESVVVLSIEYYKVMPKLMERTPKRVVANYFGMMATRNLGHYTISGFHQAEFKFNQHFSGIVKDSPLWRQCYSDVSSYVSKAISRLYVDSSFSPMDKRVASVMVNDIKESFDELIKKSDWLDTTTRAKALTKLDAIHQNVGYPDWILDNTELDKHYALTKKVNPDNYFENIFYRIKSGVYSDYNNLRVQDNLNHSWPMPSHIVNAAYMPTQNSITIPAGILTPPYFDIRLPAFVNYGAIGVVIGHELTHGFDAMGSKFGADGSLSNWWTETVAKQFKAKAECFINEYNSYVEPQTKLKLNGNNTVNENIADNGGIREAYRAFERYVQKHGKQQRLPHVSQYTPEQQFFISYSTTWCSKFRTEALKSEIKFDVHSPGRYRVNVPLSNFNTFSDAFKCSAKSRMNRKDKCVLW